MFLVYDPETGEELRREAEPVLGAGEASILIPASALMEPPVCVWSPAQRGFVDVPLVDGPALLRLLTAAEITAAVQSPAMVPVILQWLLLLAGGQPQRVNSALHAAGAAAMLAAGVLTEARHAEFLAGIPPQ